MKDAVVRLEIDVPRGIRLVCLNYPDGTTDEIDLNDDGGRTSDDDQGGDDEASLAALRRLIAHLVGVFGTPTGIRHDCEDCRMAERIAHGQTRNVP